VDNDDRVRPIAGFSAVLDAHEKASDAADTHAEAEQRGSPTRSRPKRRRRRTFVKGLDALYAARSRSEAQDKFNSDLADFADKVQAAQLSGDAYATSLDESTRTGRENAEMVRGLTKDILDTAKAAAHQRPGRRGRDERAAQRARQGPRRSSGSTKQRGADLRSTCSPDLDGLEVDTKIDLDTTRRLPRLRTSRSSTATSPSASRAGSARPARPARHRCGRRNPDSIASRELLDARARQKARDDRSRLRPAMQDGPATEAEKQKQQADADQRKRDAEQRQRDAEQAARDRQRQQDSMMANKYEFGGISAEDYKAYLNERLAQTVQFSDDWADIWHKIDQVNQDIGAGWLAAKAQIKANEDEWMRVLRVQHEIGELSTADYIKQLEKRLATLAKYSEEWFAVWQEIQQLKEETNQNVLDIIAAVEKQRQFDEGFYGAADQRTLTAERGPGVVVQAGATTTRTYSPTFHVTTADPNGYSANQKMRDDAFLAGV
jgi:hypothetical protein